MPDPAQSPVQTIADRMSAIYKARYGRGPTSVAVHITRDAVICILLDVNTPSLSALVEFGAVDVAQSTHHRLQIGMAEDMTAMVQEATGRSVHTHVPGFNAEAAVTTDVFLLEPESR